MARGLLIMSISSAPTQVERMAFINAPTATVKTTSALVSARLIADAPVRLAGHSATMGAPAVRLKLSPGC